jgi:hypothetical protein
MSAGELGETAAEVEDSLELVLELTSKWNAILLLDECDMFLEARTTADIKRNRLISSEFQIPHVERCPYSTQAYLSSLLKETRILPRRNVPH